MNVVGIVAEYNPFHRGHEYHIAKAKELTGADYCVVVMSGDFTQRGTPAIADKHVRTRMALLGGADLVLELPTRYACSSAENFAAAAVQVLHKTGIITHICFGSECNDIVPISAIAKLLADEPGEYRSKFQEYLKNGDSYPSARAKAVASYLNSEIYDSILKSPNNLLGIEYIKELYRRHSSIIPVSIQRTGQDYHGSAPIKDSEYASASFIRDIIENGGTENARNHLPGFSHHLIEEQVAFHRCPIVLNDFSNLLHYKLLTSTAESLADYLDVSEDLARKIAKHIPEYEDFQQFCSLLKSRELTYTRVNRALLHILLDIKKEHCDSKDLLSYASVLGLKKTSSHLLRNISDNGHLSIVSKNADADKLLNKRDLGLFKETMQCSHIYESVIADKLKGAPRNLYLVSPVIL